MELATLTYPGLCPELSEERVEQTITEWHGNERITRVVGHDTLSLATCPEHGVRTDYYPVPPDCTSEFCPACAHAVEKWERRPLDPGSEWSRADQSMDRAERAEDDYFTRLER